MKKLYAFEVKNGNVKIGVSKNVEKRIKTISTTSGVNVTRMFETDFISNSYEMELVVKNKFKQKNIKSEWYNETFDIVTEFIKSISNDFKYDDNNRGELNAYKALEVLDEFAKKEMEEAEKSKKKKLKQMLKITAKMFKEHYDYQKQIGGEELKEFEKDYPKICKGIFDAGEYNKYKADMHSTLDFLI